MDIVQITRDYFSLPNNAKEKIYERIFGDVVMFATENYLTPTEVIIEIDKLIDVAEYREDYEVAELLNKLKLDLLKIKEN